MNILEITIIAYLLVGTVFASTIGVVIWVLYFKKYIRVTILRKVGNMYKQIKTLKPKLDVSSVDHKGKTYTIDLKKAIMDNRNRPILYYNEEDTQPLTYQDNKTVIESDIVESIYHSNMFKQILNSGKADKMFMWMIVGCIICIAVISVFSIWKITELQNTIIQIKTLPPTNSTTIEPILPQP